MTQVCAGTSRYLYFIVFILTFYLDDRICLYGLNVNLNLLDLLLPIPMPTHTKMHIILKLKF